MVKNTTTELVLETTKKIKEIRKTIIDYRNKNGISKEDEQKLGDCEGTIEKTLKEVVELTLTGI